MKKGQAAMEFLMTYGWAIIVVLAAIAALAYFGVLSPDRLLPERTTFPAPLANIDKASIADAANTVTVTLTNSVGNQINITRLVLNGTSGTACNTIAAQIRTGATASGALADFVPADGRTANNGDFITLQFNCTAIPSGKFSADVAVDYTDMFSGQAHTTTGSITGRAV
ncbi:MAG: hypothetical protein V1725_05200 [archaeon]